MEDNQKDFIILKIDSLEKLTELKFENQAMALILQAKDYERRLDGMGIEIERLRKRSDETGGKEQGKHDVWGWIFGMSGIGIALITFFLRMK